MELPAPKQVLILEAYIAEKSNPTVEQTYRYNNIKEYITYPKLKEELEKFNEIDSKEKKGIFAAASEKYNRPKRIEKFLRKIHETSLDQQISSNNTRLASPEEAQRYNKAIEMIKKDNLKNGYYKNSAKQLNSGSLNHKQYSELADLEEITKYIQNVEKDLLKAHASIQQQNTQIDKQRHQIKGLSFENNNLKTELTLGHNYSEEQVKAAAQGKSPIQQQNKALSNKKSL